jgi:CheY-like chemotaxis protein
MHGGSVRASSAGPVRGSEFELCLPLAAPSAEPVTGKEVGTAGAATRRILVVDDSQDAAESLALLLGTKGHDLRTAYNGEAALEVVDAFRPEVVLLDIGLPRMDGYEVARQLRKRPETEHALLIALTGYGQDQDRRHSAQAGFDYHLVKPVHPDELLKLITRHYEEESHATLQANPRALPEEHVSTP